MTGWCSSTSIRRTSACCTKSSCDARDVARRRRRGCCLPLTLHLGPAEADAFEANREYLETLGFEIEGFGGSTLIVHTVPMPHPRFDAERACATRWMRSRVIAIAGTATRHEHLAATVACKAAIKAGDQLSPGEMRALFVALARHHASGARRARARDDRAAVVGRAGAAVWPADRHRASSAARRRPGSRRSRWRSPIEYGATIISADSRQVYRGFDIGTAKPSVERAETRSRTMGIDSPTRPSATPHAQWAAMATDWMQ